jgi:hypothetical protein
MNTHVTRSTEERIANHMAVYVPDVFAASIQECNPNTTVPEFRLWLRPEVA